jgi:polyisoprenoid-binding protein YceI
MKTPTHLLPLKWLSLSLLFMLLLAACGSTSEAETAVQREAAADTPASTATAEPPAPEPETAESTTETEGEMELEADEEEAPETDAADEPETAAGQPVRFLLNADLSEARFIIDEILRGDPFTVVGVTNQVDGELTVDLANPSQTEIGEITVDVSTLATDNNMRNRAINNFILNTSQYQFVHFAPTALLALPQEITVGQTIEFQIEGELTIRTITQPVVFDVVVDLVSDQEIRGLASTVILRDDFNLTIPSVPQVAGVDEDLRLEIEFVATAVNGSQ